MSFSNNVSNKKEKKTHHNLTENPPLMYCICVRVARTCTAQRSHVRAVNMLPAGDILLALWKCHLHVNGAGSLWRLPLHLGFLLNKKGEGRKSSEL